ncbi:hypothetical protein AKJ16_DCAP16530 [Drosera capensis]
MRKVLNAEQIGNERRHLLWNDENEGQCVRSSIFVFLDHGEVVPRLTQEKRKGKEKTTDASRRGERMCANVKPLDVDRSKRRVLGPTWQSS